MSKSFCYWTVADGRYADMMESVIYSARLQGVEEPFFVWSDKKVKGATETFRSGDFDKSHYLFKINFLKHKVFDLFYDYYIFLDSDTWFVRKPEDVLAQLKGDPIHVAMESNCNNPSSLRPDWWDCPLNEFCDLMWEKGVRSNSVFNNNAGMFIVQHEAIDHVFRLAYEFWYHAEKKGRVFTEEAALAYAAHMLMADPYVHQLKENRDFWASDWLGHWKDKIPKNEPWNFTDYMTMEEYEVNPAIVHAMRSKDLLVSLSKSL